MSDKRPVWHKDRGLLLLLAAAAFLLAVGVTLRGPRDALRRLMPGASRPDMGAPTGPAVRSEPALTFNEITRLLAPFSGDPVAMRFAREFMDDPELRALWRQASRPPGSRDLRHVFHVLRGTRAFGDLLKRFSKEKGFREMVEAVLRDPLVTAVVRREAETMKPSAAGDRMLVRTDPRTPPAPQARARPGGRAGERPAAASGPRTRYGPADAAAQTTSGLDFILTHLEEDDRKILRRRINDGTPFAKACKEEGLSAECVKVADECAADSVCAPWLAQTTGRSRDPVFGLRQNPPTRLPPPEPPPAPPPEEPPPPPPPGEPPPPEPPPAPPGDPPPAPPEAPPTPPEPPSPPTSTGTGTGTGTDSGSGTDTGTGSGTGTETDASSCIPYGALCGYSETACGNSYYTYDCGGCCDPHQFDESYSKCPGDPYSGEMEKGQIWWAYCR